MERLKTFLEVAQAGSIVGAAGGDCVRQSQYSRQIKELEEKNILLQEQRSQLDKKKKEEVEARNAADQMVYQTEKSMNEFGDKVTQADKDSVNPKLDALKEALKGTDVEAIKKAQEELQTAFYAVAERIYKEQGAAAQQAEAAQTDVQGEGTNAAGGSDDNVVDADYTDAN